MTSEISQDTKAMFPPVKIFAFIIGINDYAEEAEFPTLQGCVNDARAFRRYLLQMLHAESDNILCLENGAATRAGILSAFKSHFLDNTNIPDHGAAAMIFFFAGHGSRVSSPDNLIATDRKVEAICLVDERTIDAAGKYVHTIPDYVLGWLLSELAQKKGPNITVILDSCHSGGMGRNAGRHRTARTSSRSIPLELDSHLWKGKADTVQSYRLWAPSATSHVLLAACREDETAREVEYNGTVHGHFSKHLLDHLRSTDLENTTYSELIGRMPKLLGQTPHCGGTRRNCLIFNVTYPAAGPHAILTPYADSGFRGSSTLQPKDSDSPQMFRVEMGTVEGVVPGTEFAAYAPSNNFLCTLVAQSVQVGHMILVAEQNTPHIEIPSGSRAVVSDWKNDAMILLVYLPADFPYTAHVFPATQTRPTSTFAEAPSLEEAHIVVRTDGDEIVIQPQMITMRTCQPETRFALLRNPEHLPDAIDGIAHFIYFLDHTNASDALKGKFALEMHRLRGDYPQRAPDPRVGQDGNMIEDGEARFASEKGAKYGFTIRNTSSQDLFPYLFYFDPEAYTIHAPLLHESTVTIGMGSEPAFEFTLSLGEESSAGLLKVFVTSVYVDLGWI
ncbi:caspase domain-containing protein [Mycena leptocephala]|nr:caspase domain-containing protein [Mycena leptocephala]